MPRGDVETDHEGGAWHDRIEGTGAVLGTFPREDEAQAAGRVHAEDHAVSTWCTT